MKVYLITITKVGCRFVNFQMVDSEEKAIEYVRAFNSKHTKYIAKWEEIQQIIEVVKDVREDKVEE